LKGLNKSLLGGASKKELGQVSEGLIKSLYGDLKSLKTQKPKNLKHPQKTKNTEDIKTKT
jgi:hypothetical protein